MYNLMNTTAPWRREILRDTGDGGGGAGAGDEGASNAAPASDRTAMLEERLNQIGNAFEGYIQNNEEQQRRANTSRLETQIKAAEAKAARDVDQAEAKLAEAFDEGDGAGVAKAQRAVAEAAARRERVSVQAQQMRDEMKASERKTPQGNYDLDTTNLDSWKQKHASWYGVDKDLTKYAHELDAQIRENGVLSPGTSEYFDAIDRQMRSKFPDRFSGTPPTGDSSSGTAMTGNGGNSSQTRIPASVAEGYRRMGINIDDPDTAKRMVANREKAVQKGWLPEKAATGRIMTR